VTTEVGRQPWVVYGLQRTADAVSAHGTLHMSISLLGLSSFTARCLAWVQLYGAPD
jgi:cytochrome bd-type quinol oxidase subunit 1